MQAKVLAPLNVTIIPVDRKSGFLKNIDKFDPSDTVILFPSPDSVRLADLANLEHGEPDETPQSSSPLKPKNKVPTLCSIKNVVVIEATWTKARSILNSEMVRALTKVKIESRKTLYWHFQKHGKEFLSTIEAIYYFLKDYELEKGESCGENLDDLLSLYSKEYHTIIGEMAKSDVKRPPKSWEIVDEGFLLDFE